MKKTTIIFDFDGTVADVLEIGIEIANKLADEFGFRKITDENREELRGSTARQVMKKLNIPIWKLGWILSRGKTELANLINNVYPFDGMPYVLKELKERGFALGMVTLNSPSNTRAFLERHDLTFFDFVDTEKRAFKKHRAFKKVLKSHNLSVGDVVYVGDEVRDIVAAKKVGMPIVAVSWGLNSHHVLEEHCPDYLVDTPEELLKTLQTYS